MKRLSLLLLSITLGFRVSAEAQQRTLADFVGIWERIPDAEEGSGLPDDPKNQIYRRLAVRLDSTVLTTVVSVNHGDTLAVTTKGLLSCPDCSDAAGDPIKIPPTIRGDTLSWPGAARGYVYSYQDSSRMILQDQELVVSSPKPGRSGTYRPARTAKHALDGVIRLGYGPSRPVPAHPQPPTGTLTDLVGAWERTRKDSTGERKDSTELRMFRIFRSDSVMLEIRTHRDGTDTLTQAFLTMPGEGWRREPKDSSIYQDLVSASDTVTATMAVLREHQLTFYNPWSKTPEEAGVFWQATDWLKRP